MLQQQFTHLNIALAGIHLPHLSTTDAMTDASKAWNTFNYGSGLHSMNRAAWSTCG